MLPPITDDLDQARRHLAEHGVARVANALTADELSSARRRVEEQAAGERAAGCAWFDGTGTMPRKPGRDGPNQRIWNLVNKGEIFRRIVLKTPTLGLIRHLLGEDVLLSSFTANIAHLGGVPMVLHTDQGYVPPETPYPVVANIMGMLVDFTEANGATRVVPGSHLSTARPDPSQRPPTVAATGAAGTALVFDGRTWHGTGANETTEPRSGILSYFCRPFIRQQENFTMSLAPEVIERAPPELLRLLGFATWHSLGMVEGTIHGTINPRPTRFVTELGPSWRRS